MPACLRRPAFSACSAEPFRAGSATAGTTGCCSLWYYGLRGLSLLYLPFAFDLSFYGLSLFCGFYGLDGSPRSRRPCGWRRRHFWRRAWPDHVRVDRRRPPARRRVRGVSLPGVLRTNLGELSRSLHAFRPALPCRRIAAVADDRPQLRQSSTRSGRRGVAVNARAAGWGVRRLWHWTRQEAINCGIE